MVFAIHQETGGSDEGLAMAQEWSARSPKHDEAFLEARVWPYIKSGGGITGGTIMSLAARLHGWTEPIERTLVAAAQEGGIRGAGGSGRTDRECPLRWSECSLGKGHCIKNRVRVIP